MGDSYKNEQTISENNFKKRLRQLDNFSGPIGPDPDSNLVVTKGFLKFSYEKINFSKLNRSSLSVGTELKVFFAVT